MADEEVPLPEEDAPPAPLNPAVEEDAKTLAAQMNTSAPAGVTFQAINNPVDGGWIIQGKDAGGDLVYQVLGIQTQ